MGALHDLEAERKEFERSSDYYYVLRRFASAATMISLLPNGLARAFIRAFDKVNQAVAGSWDEVFGTPYSKGTHVPKIRERKTAGVKVYTRVKQLHETEQAPLDDTLFEKVGAEFGFKKTKASELYDHWDNYSRKSSKNSRQDITCPAAIIRTVDPQ